MRQPLCSSARIAALLLPIALLPLLMAGKRPSQNQQPTGRFHDWTTRHVVYSQSGTLAALRAAEEDPRARFRWHEAEQERSGDFFGFRRHRRGRRHPPKSELHRDWSISLGGGTTAPDQFPAKFTFDVNAAASCANDFAVFPVDVNGGAAQPNIVAFSNLYSGNGGGVVGMCNRVGAPTGNDTKTDATVLWSYNVHAIVAGGAVPGSPVLSLDGKKVAFVESAAGNAAHFHVLAWKSGDGVVANLQSTTSPKAITTFTGTSPIAGSGTSTDLTLGVATATISSPFVDYVRDLAYVGNDQGVVFRIKNVFCTVSCPTAAPSLDATWGVGGAVTVGAGSCAGTANSTLTGPVLDFVSLNVFVGCADGKVYGFNSAGTPLTTASIAVGNGSATGGVVDSPIVDGVNGFIYAVSGTGTGANVGNAVIVQATTSLGGPCAGALCVARVGAAGVHRMHAPAFNDAYFTNATSTTWLIYQLAYSAAVARVTLYAANFSGTRTLTPGAAANVLDFGTHPAEYSPLTEFNNAGTDQLFFGVMHSNANLNMGHFTIGTFPTAAPPGIGLGNGPSGMIIDNASASAQASSIYFGAQGNNTAVKLTQVGFN